MYKFSEKSMHPFLRTCVDKIMSTEGGQTDGQTDWQTARQTDREGETNIPPKTLFARGYKKLICKAIVIPAVFVPSLVEISPVHGSGKKTKQCSAETMNAIGNEHINLAFI